MDTTKISDEAMRGFESVAQEVDMTSIELIDFIGQHLLHESDRVAYGIFELAKERKR